MSTHRTKSIRRATSAIVAFTFSFPLVMAAPQPVARATPNAVVTENALAGHPDWNDRTVAVEREIDLFVNESSYRAGDSIEIQTSIQSGARYRTEIYRLGWYDGDGARLITCLPGCSSDTTGSFESRSIDLDTGEVTTPLWGDFDQTIIVPADWVSGYYIAIAELTTGANAGLVAQAPFIVREPAAGNRAPTVVQAATTTWHAYNSWGGASAYTTPLRATHLNFDRPIRFGANTTPLAYELQLVRFLERNGYDVSYTTGLDTHRTPETILGRNLVISNGHDEYWSTEQFDAFEAARDSGVNIMFMSSNAVYWHVRYDQDERRMIVYKDEPGETVPPGELPTRRFRHIDRPECQLLGVQYSALTRGGEETFLDYSVNDTALTHPWFAGTGIEPGATFAKRVGYEWDAIEPGCAVPEPPVTLFHNEDTVGEFAHAVTYDDPESGATVFSSGSMAFAFSLDDWRSDGSAIEPPDARLQAFIRNVVDDLSGTPGIPPPDADGDGIPDSSDLCPDEPAIVDVNQDGCEDPPAVDPVIALIAGNDPVPSGDRPIRDLLINRGWDVTIFDDDAIPTNGALASFNTIVITSSVVPAKIPSRLKAIDGGMVVSETFAFEALGLATAASNVTGQTQLNFLEPASEISNGRTGTTTVSTATGFGAASPSSEASVVATTLSNLPAVFTYQPGATDVVGAPMAGRRVGYHWSYSAPAAANGIGRQLFVDAVYWAAQGPLSPPTPAPPAFTDQPPPVVNLVVGERAVLTATAAGEPQPIIQWRRDGEPIAGATSAELSIGPVTLADDASVFDALATNSEGFATSTAAVLTVSDAPLVQRVLFVAGNASPPSRDRRLGDRLTSRGFEVVYADDDTVGVAAANNVNLVIITSSVVPSKIGTLFTDVAVPVLVSEPYLYDDFGFVSSNSAAGESPPATQLDIVSPSHPMAAGLGGTATVLTTASTMSQAAPAGDATVIADIAGSSTAAAVFAYEQDAALAVGSAPARRVGFLTSYASAYTLNGNGYALFDAAVDWAMTPATPPMPSAPEIVIDPASISVVVGGAPVFTVVATGSPAPSLQWRRDGAAIDGETAPTLSIGTVSLSDDGAIFDVVASNATGTATSVGATLTVTEPISEAPSIVHQPAPTVEATDGSSATFTVSVVGFPAPTLQWRRDGVPIAGATSDAFTIAPALLADSGAEFDVVATNSEGTVTSNVAVLTVTEANTTVTVVGAPTLTVVIGDGSLGVTWEAVAGASKYQLRYRPAGSFRRWDAPTNALARTLTGLESGLSHEVEVRSLIGSTWGPWTTVTVVVS